jgi:DNA-damage-inducible protein D
MSALMLVSDGSPFDAIRQVRADGSEFWSARDLMPLLGYSGWENFHSAVNRARLAAENSQPGSDHVRSATKMIIAGKGATREAVDYELTRFGAYLVAMNGDPRKDEIAAAQTYFAVQTRRAEIAQQASPLGLARLMLEQLEQQDARLTAVESQMLEVRGELVRQTTTEWVTALGYARRNGLSTDNSSVAKLGRAATKASRELNIPVHTQSDQRWGSVNAYHVDALEIAAERIAGAS